MNFKQRDEESPSLALCSLLISLSFLFLGSLSRCCSLPSPDLSFSLALSTLRQPLIRTSRDDEEGQRNLGK